MVDYVMIALIWLFILAAVLAAAGIPAATWLMLQKPGKRRVIVCFLVCLVLVVAILARLCQRPILAYTSDCEAQLSAAQENAVMAVSDGFYSGILPLVPVLVTVTTVDGEYLGWTIRYFPFGNMEMEYGSDGYSIVKPLN